MKVVADNGHAYTGNQEGVAVFFTTGEAFFSSSVERLNVLYAHRPGKLVDAIANAAIAPEPTLANRSTYVDIYDLHVAHIHVHEGALRKTAERMGVTLEGKLHEYKD